jgi:hypothetical protein
MAIFVSTDEKLLTLPHAAHARTRGNDQDDQYYSTILVQGYTCTNVTCTCMYMYRCIYSLVPVVIIYTTKNIFHSDNFLI